MKLLVEVTQEDIDHGQTGACIECMLGKATNRAGSLAGYKGIFRIYAENLEQELDPDGFPYITHRSVMYRAPAAKEEDILPLYAKLPEEAIKNADSWENLNGDSGYKRYFETVQPFSFTLEFE